MCLKKQLIDLIWYEFGPINKFFWFPKMILNVQLLGELESHWTILDIVFPPRKKPAPCLGPVLKDVRQRFWWVLPRWSLFFVHRWYSDTFTNRRMTPKLDDCFFWDILNKNSEMFPSQTLPFDMSWKPLSPRLRTLYLLKGQVRVFLRPNQRLGGWWKSWSHIWVKDFVRAQPTRLRIAVSQAGVSELTQLGTCLIPMIYQKFS